jgi:putative heme iron utilization protein
MPHSKQEVLGRLLNERRVLSLAVTVDGAPVIGLLPFALSRDARALVVHASRLARHTKGLVAGAPFDVLVHEPDAERADPLQLARVTLRGQVEMLEEGTTMHADARRAYLAKFPAAEPITALGDFAFFRLAIAAGRLVTGFASASNVTLEMLDEIGQQPTDDGRRGLPVA